MNYTLSKVVSSIFSPLTIPGFIALLIVWLNPYLFHPRLAFFFVAFIVIWSFFIPLFGLVLMKKLEFIKDLSLSEKGERIIPYFLFIFCFTIIFYVINNMQLPGTVKAIFIGMLVSICISFFLNNFFNISTHANAMGSFFGASLSLLSISTRNIEILIIFIIIIAGIVMSARLFLNRHNLKDVFSGFLLGLFSQLLAAIVFNVF